MQTVAEFGVFVGVVAGLALLITAVIELSWRAAGWRRRRAEQAAWDTWRAGRHREALTANNRLRKVTAKAERRQR